MKAFKLIVFFLLVSSLANSQEVVEVIPSSDTVPEYSKIEFNIKVKAAFKDPFDQEDIRVDAIVFPNASDSLVVPGFYCSGDAELSEWQIRFAARSVGEYSVYFKVTNEEGSVRSDVIHFTVTESEQNGFLTMDNSGVFLKFDSGQKFRGIGTDFGWEAKDFEDQKFTYQFYFQELAANNGNFTRSWMCPYNLPLEWNDVDNHRYVDDTLRYNTSGANKMDEVLGLAQQYGIYMMLALDFHGELKTQPNYWGTGNYWASNPYNVDNGGPCNTPAEFFSNPIAKKRYKDRLRYFIARWGYSTHLGVIEFWNEVDNAMADENIPPEDIVSWHQEMSDYLKKIDPYGHIMSTSISHRTITGLFEIDNLDFAQAHIYSQTTNLAQTIAELTTTYKKPGVVGEYAYDWTGAPEPVDEDAYVRYFHLGLWRGLFSVSPILPLTWWWEFFIDDGQLEELSKISTFSDIIRENSSESIESVALSGDERVEKLALKSDSCLFIWLRNQKASGISDVSIDVEDYDISGDLYYTVYDCKNGTFSEQRKLNGVGNSFLTLEYLTAQQEVAIYVTPAKDMSVSSRDLKKKADVKLFPNPTSEYCTLRIESEKSGKLTIQLITLDGRVMQTFNNELLTGMNEFEISLHGIKNQMCILRMKSDDMLVSKKLMIY